MFSSPWWSWSTSLFQHMKYRLVSALAVRQATHQATGHQAWPASPSPFAPRGSSGCFGWSAPWHRFGTVSHGGSGDSSPHDDRIWKLWKLWLRKVVSWQDMTGSWRNVLWFLGLMVWWTWVAASWRDPGWPVGVYPQCLMGFPTCMIDTMINPWNACFISRMS